MEETRQTRKARPSTKAILVLLSCAIALLLGECAVRVVAPLPTAPFAHNPVIAEQTQSANVFVADHQLGHRLVGEFVNSYGPGMRTFDRIVSEVRQSGKPVILNIGDSSTSGWDSNIVLANRNRMTNGDPPLGPFHHYFTYSDFMAEEGRFYIVNAGVPGYSSVQCAQYCEELLTKFRTCDITLSIVTIYVGNNDCAWNGNVRDVYSVGASVWRPQIPRLVEQSLGSAKIFTRVGVSEYEQSIRRMIRAIRATGALPLVIQPAVPHRWAPGLRAYGLESERDQILQHSSNDLAIVKLRSAIRDYALGQDSLTRGDESAALKLLESARESDFVVPRIKSEYRAKLQSIAREDNVGVVCVVDQIPLDDTMYFCDYCHPIEPTNRLIAAAILQFVDSQSTKNH